MVTSSSNTSLVVSIEAHVHYTRPDRLVDLRLMVSLLSFLAQYFFAVRTEPFDPSSRRFLQTYTFKVKPLAFALIGSK